MIIVLAKEFNLQARNVQKISGRIYQNRVFIPGVIFALRCKEVAIKYCREWMKNNPSFLCILVEDTTHIQVWYETKRHRVYNRGQKKMSVNKASSSLLSSHNLPIDKMFVVKCQQALTEHIGPIAKIVIKKAIAKNVRLNRKQFISRLIKELQQVKQVQGLEEQLEQLLDN